MMIIDERVILTDTEGGSRLTIRGKSLESILDYRIVWNQTTLSGNFQNGVKKLIDDAIINPIITDRKIPNFKFEASTDARITAMKVDTQFTHTSLYEAIQTLCDKRKIGFKVILNENNEFVFSLYMGEDRSYEQTDNPQVIFSPTYENIVNSNYLESNSLEKNVALVAGEGEGEERRTVTIGGGIGINRKEVAFDARDISSTVYPDDEEGETTEMTEEEYNALLSERGNEKMEDYKFTETFEAEVETTRMFVYNKDFFIGDIVQIENEYGLERPARITEIIFSNDENGAQAVPTFDIISQEGETA